MDLAMLAEQWRFFARTGRFQNQLLLDIMSHPEL